jgi:CRISPR-associated protein Cmr1
MRSITFTCKVITPLFLNGAEGQTPELRPPGIKAAMRFWWRALHAHLPLAEMKKQESELFGGSGDKISRSKIIVRVSEPGQLLRSTEVLVPHKEFMKAHAIAKGQQFDVKLSIVSNTKENIITIEKLAALFELSCLLGGLGKRVRRGMGSISIIGADGLEGPTYPVKASLPYIHQLISQFSPFYTLTPDSIQFNYAGKCERYGFIKQIQLGRPRNERLLLTISNATHTMKEKSGFAYEPSMGHASKGRYASPVYVSVVEGSLCPIITTLNIAPDKNEHQASLLIQEEFKNIILK